MLLCKLLTKARFGYKMIALLACNYKVLKKNLNLQQNQIKKDYISINKMLMNRYQNYNKMTIVKTSWNIKKVNYKK